MMKKRSGVVESWLRGDSTGPREEYIQKYEQDGYLDEYEDEQFGLQIEPTNRPFGTQYPNTEQRLLQSDPRTPYEFIGRWDVDNTTRDLVANRISGRMAGSGDLRAPTQATECVDCVPFENIVDWKGERITEPGKSMIGSWVDQGELFDTVEVLRGQDESISQVFQDRPRPKFSYQTQ